MQVSGTIISIKDPETRGNYTSRKLWLKTNDSYPQTLEIECGGKKADLFDSLSEGQSVTIDINLNGREYNGRVYNTIAAWKVTNQ